MMPSRRSCLLGALTLLCLLAPIRPARAALVTFNYTGTITTLNDPTGILGGQVHVGDRYSGTLVYDTSAKGSILTPTREIYDYQPTYSKNYIPPVGISAQVGTFSIKPDYFYDDMTVQVFNDAPTNLGIAADGLISAQTYNGPAGQYESDLTLIDTTASAFSSLALPSSVGASQFNIGTFSYSQLVSGGTGLVPVNLFSGTIDGLSPAAVPEPASLTLLGGGLLGIGAWRRLPARRRSA